MTACVAVAVVVCETVAKIIEARDLKNEEILVKDCDSFFDHEVESGNYVCVSNIREHEVLKKLSSKSFVVSNENGIITEIVEKRSVLNRLRLDIIDYVWELACEIYFKY